ncbi:Histidine kinase-, DNA gyrase B-, and HSP90-like ATPase [Prevotellaceae bacterium MN60]|nr:Histidine kinase-, DNA gyrase B-, and HSP90-like ATPase [Prevotellaceae bacterium MN60]
MNKKVLVFYLSLLFCGTVCAEEVQKSELQQRAEAVDVKQNISSARSLYIHAFNDYINKGQTRQGIECAVKATALYYKENFYKEAFDLLRRADQTIMAANAGNSEKAAMHYLTTKERMQMYIKLKKGASAQDQLNNMERLASQANDESVSNDLLYNKAIYYYTFGQTAEGNAVFKEMANKLTAQKEYDKVDEVFKTLIASGRRSNNASLVAQSYSSYIAWKDSTDAMKRADEIGALKKQIADNEASISEKDSSLTTRMVIIVGLAILAAALAAVLLVGAFILMRFILQTRRQKKLIAQANENNALKAKFISNISAQLEPSFKKLDSNNPEVKALLEFSNHIQTLSELDNTIDEPVELEEVSVPSFCEEVMSHINGKVKEGVTLTTNAPKMSASINKEYVSHILLHLLKNAAIYTPAGGTIVLEFKKRSAHTLQFLVSNTGSTIPEEKREDVFKPFLEIKDLSQGDGLGLPICKQMAVKMNGDLEIDPVFTKGVRFVLDLHV